MNDKKINEAMAVLAGHVLDLDAVSALARRLPGQLGGFVASAKVETMFALGALAGHRKMQGHEAVDEYGLPRFPLGWLAAQAALRSHRPDRQSQAARPSSLSRHWRSSGKRSQKAAISKSKSQTGKGGK